MTERRSDRILSIVLSILIHAAIVGALLWGWWQYRQPTVTPPSLAIEATVEPHAPPQAAPPSPPATPPPEPANPPPAAPSPDQQAEQQARAEQAAREKEQEQERAVREKRAAEEQAEQQRRREQAERASAEKAAAEKAEAERAAAAKAEADRAAAAKAEADRKAQQLAQQRKAELERERAQREADLRSQLASEEHLNAVQSSPAKAEYLSLITARINRAWIRPSSARAGIRCSLHITQIPGGEITHVVVAGCNGDEAVRQSVETAAYRASPLPAPSDPALFDPNIDVTFAPDE
jgi:colicin import membrane protein